MPEKRNDTKKALNEIAQQNSFSSFKALIVYRYYTHKWDLSEIATTTGIGEKILRDFMRKEDMPVRQRDWKVVDTNYPLCPCCGLEFPAKKKGEDK